jgi:hypothetical protein
MLSDSSSGDKWKVEKNCNLSPNQAREKWYAAMTENDTAA